MLAGLFFLKTGGAAVGPILFVSLPLFVLAAIFIFLFSIWLNFTLIRVIDALYKTNAAPPIKLSLIEAKTTVWRGLVTIVAAGFYAAWPIFVGIFGFAVYRFVFQIADINLPVLGRGLSVLFGLVGVYGLFHAIYYSIKLVFSVYAAVIDGATVKESLSLSRSITKQRWWGILGRLAGTTIIAYIAMIMADVILATIGGLFGSVGDKVATTLSSFVSLLITPFMVAAVVILFNEAKKTPVSASPKD